MTLELEKLIVKEGVDTVVTLTPFSSKDGTKGMRFQADFPRTGIHSVLDYPPPFAEHMGWHMWTNEDDRSVEP